MPAGPTHLLEAGQGRLAVVFLPGTNENAATSLPLLALLAAGRRVLAVDLPGLVAGTCRPSLAPGILPDRALARVRAVPCVVGTGLHDPFLPPSPVLPAARRRLGPP